MELSRLDRRSKALRKTIIDMLAGARRGHPGSAMSIVEILRVLYDDVLLYKPTHPKWNKRDRFILSKGHGGLALYTILAEKGFFAKSHLSTYCQIDGMLGGHPSGDIPGVDFSTGSEGHGLSLAVGVALNARIKKLDYRTFVLVGDGECDEGSIWEAALSAGKLKLHNLTVIVDRNHMQSYGPTAEVADLEPFADKWKAFGFSVSQVDGHDVEALQSVFGKIPFSQSQPSVVICKTIKGKGITHAEQNPTWHHKRGISDEEIERMYKSVENY